MQAVQVINGKACNGAEAGKEVELETGHASLDLGVAGEPAMDFWYSIVGLDALVMRCARGLTN
jgi:hypothetical protein